MNTINVDLSTGEALNLPIGRQGENNVTQVIFDFSGLKTEFGSGTLSLSVKRPKEYIPYAQTMTISGTNATWLVNETDTGNFGCGEIQLTYTVSGKVAKTVIYKYTVLRSIGADGEYPIPGQTWQEEMEDEIEEIKADLSDLQAEIEGGGGGGLSADLKAALDQLAQKVAYIDDDGADYYDALHNALYPPAPPKTVSYINAVYTQSGVVYDTDTLDSLKSNLVVTAYYTDSTSGVATNYTLSGTLTTGTSTITVSYGGKTTTFTVVVTENSTAAVIMTEGVVWDKTAPNTYTVSGFGITQWYDYEFTQAALEACSYWDSTNSYMNQNGWSGLRYCAPDYLTYAAGYSWPGNSRYKYVAGKDHVYTVYVSPQRNTESNFGFARYSVPWVEANGVSFSIPLLDIDYCYAYWKKGMTYGIYPTGVSEGDILFAGKYTPYYNLTNISQAPTLSSISATFTQGSTVVTTSTALADLKPMLSVTATYSGNKTLPVNLGLVTLSGTLTTGTSTITATYNDKTTTFNVTVS